nr:hypothetical protein CFP56_02566 [Quercus suber]
MFSLSSTNRLSRVVTTSLRTSRLVSISRPAQRLNHGLATAEVAQPAPPVFATNANNGRDHFPQLNILEQAWKPEYYEAISKIMKIRETYLENRSTFIEGEKLVPILRFLGAKDEDIPKLQKVSNRLYEDPTLPFRKSRNGRFCLDMDSQTLRRLEFQPFALSVEEDFKRYDSGQIRVFDEVENDLQLNSVFQALLVFKAMVIHGIPTVARPKLDYSGNKWVCTLFNLRTVTTPSMVGEPALEGVHSDGVDHTMTTFLGSDNMAADSAVTFMHDMKEQTGIKLNETTPELIKARVQHRHFLDTLMIVDHERKHSISPVYAVDKDKEATRDMLIFFTRRPVESAHISGSIDSLKAHEGLPMEVPLFVPKA